ERILPMLKTLSAPIEHTPGNHDVVDDATAETFEALTGQKPYRALTKAGWRILIVDNSRAEFWEQLPETQRNWLVDELAAGEDAPTVVFMHKPFWASTVAQGQPDPMHELFARYRVRHVVAGHWHQHNHGIFDGVQYTTIGTSGGGFSGLQQASRGNRYEHGWLELDGDTSNFTVVVDGQRLPLDHFTYRDQQFVRSLSPQVLAARLRRSAAGWELETRIQNPLKTPLRSELRVFGARTVKPLPIELETGQVYTQRFPVPASGSAYPLPTLEIDLPFPNGKLQPYRFLPVFERDLRMPLGVKPTLNGEFNTNEWDDAATLEGFGNAAGKKSRAETTRVWLKYDREHIYFAARCVDARPDELHRIHFGRDGHVHYDDRIGMILAPSPTQIFWFYVNPNGAVWDLSGDLERKHFDRGWDGVVAAASIDEAGWTNPTLMGRLVLAPSRTMEE
ncbi:MAG: metallophosphoesterase, partial [Myxococcota bacterium]